MPAITNKSVRNFLKSVFKKLKLTDNEFAAIRKIIDKAQYDCCSVVTVYWLNSPDTTSAPNATPQAYQIRFKDADGNVVVESDITKGSPQTFKLPPGEYQICNNILNQITNGAEGSGWTFTNSNGLSYTDGEPLGEDCDTDNGVSPLAEVYFVSNFDGGPV